MALFFQMISKPIIYKFFKDFTNHRKKTNKVVVFCSKTLIQELRLGFNVWVSNVSKGTCIDCLK